MHDLLQLSVDRVIEETPQVTWSILFMDRQGTHLAEHNASAVCATASIGKLLLLIEVARQLDAGMNNTAPLFKASGLPVADSGIWQHMHVEQLPVTDVALLVGALSDNLATNVLLSHIGLNAVDRCRRSLGLESTRLHDYVRDERSVENPPTLSSGSALELCGLMHALVSHRVVNARVSSQVLNWLAPGVDLSMVGGAFGLDPLAHTVADRGVQLWNKTGTNEGVRADIGTVKGLQGQVSFAVIANFSSREATTSDARDQAVTAMQRLGDALADCV